MSNILLMLVYLYRVYKKKKGSYFAPAQQQLIENASKITLGYKRSQTTDLLNVDLLSYYNAQN